MASKIKVYKRQFRSWRTPKIDWSHDFGAYPTGWWIRRRNWWFDIYRYSRGVAHRPEGLTVSCTRVRFCGINVMMETHYKRIGVTDA